MFYLMLRKTSKDGMQELEAKTISHGWLKLTFIPEMFQTETEQHL